MSKQTTDEKNGPVYRALKLAAWGLFLFGLTLSMSHIYGLFTWMGTGAVTAVGVVGFIDVLTLMGRVAQGAQFSKATRRAGLKVQIGGALASLVANVTSGYLTGSLGDMIAGFVLVGGYVLAERFAEGLRPASDDTRAEREAAEAARKEADRARRAAQREAAAAKKAADEKSKAERAQARRDAAERKRLAEEIRATMDAITPEAAQAAFNASVAPVSPAAPTGEQAVPAFRNTYL